MNTKIQKSKLLKYVYVFIFVLLAVSFTLTSLNSRVADATSNNSGYLNFQARLLNASGYVVPDGTYSIDFKLYSTLSTGGGQSVGTCTNTGGYTCQWEETYTGANVITVKNGYLSVYLGSITAFPSTINWNQPLYLTLNIGTGGEPSWDGEMSPRIQLTALPYAFVSSELSNTTSGNYTQTLSFGASPVGNESITLPDVSSGVVCINSSSSCGFLTGSGAGVQLQVGTPGAPQTGNFNVTGTGIVSSLLTLASSTDSLDTATSGVLSIGNTSATSITLGANTTVNSNKSFSADGATILADATNGATAVQIQNSSGTDILNANTTTNQGTINIDYLSPPGTITPTLAPTAPTITNGGTAGAVTYTYEVTATDANGATTVNSLTANTTTGNANLSASNYNKVAWSAPTSTPTSYNIYRTAVGAAGYPNSTGLIGTVATSTTSGVTPSAFTMSGTVATITFTTPPNYTVGQYVLLAGFTPSGINNSGTPVAITAISGATIKVIIPGGPYTETGMGTVTGQLALADIGNTASGSVPTTSGTLTNATQYYFKVTAIDSTGGQTTPSSELTGTTGSTNTVATTGTNRAITLSWAPVTGARGYDVYYSTSTNTETLIATTYTNSYTLSALGSPSGSPPTTNTAYNDSLGNENATSGTVNSQITLGNTAGSASTAQLDVAGSLPIAAVSTTPIIATGSFPGVYVSGNYAYVVNFTSSMQIIDISNPSSPVVVSTITTGSDPISVSVAGHYAYVANYNSNSLQVIDISNPSSPVVVGTVTTGSGPSLVSISGHYAYVINYSQSNMQIIDVSNPTNPVVVGTVTTANGPNFVYVSGRYAYVVNYYAGNLQIIDISNPASPVVDSTVSTGIGAYAVYVSGRYAYVTNNSSSSLQIIDVSNPSNPIIVGYLATSTGPTYVSISGHYAYVLNFNAGNIQIIDVSNPADPLSIGTITDASGPVGLCIQGNYAYVVNHTLSTLQIFNLGGAYTQSLQAGSTETTSLQVDGTANIGGSESISGGLIVGQSEAVSGSLSLNGNIEDGNALDSFDLPTPNTPNVTFIGTPASTTYSYQVAAVASNLTTSTASAIGTVIGSATLTAANYTDISISPVQGAAGYYLYRTAGGTSQGIIAIIANTSLTPVTPTGFSGTTSLQLTINSQTFAVGQQVVLSGFVPTLYNVTAFITATATNSITVAIPGGSGAITTEGTVTGQLNIADTALIANTSYTPPIQDSSAQISADNLSLPGTVTTSIAPAAPTVTTSGTAGSVSYTYEVVAVDANGAQTLSSATGNIATGNANLSTTNYNSLNITAVAGATNYLVYRTAVGAAGYPNSLGYIGSTTTTGAGAFKDIGYTASQSAPTTTGLLSSATTYYFKVTAIDSTGGQTTASAEVSQATGSIVSQEAITLSWAPVTGARGYDVYYEQGGAGGAETNYFTTPTNSYTLTTTTGNTAGSPPTVNSAYNNTLASSGNSQITLGNTAGSASTAQLDVAGSLPTSAVSTTSTGTNQSWPGPEVFVSGNYAYVANSNTSLQIFDVSNPANPILASTITTAQPTNVYVSGHYVYLINNYSATLQVIDVSNPSSPISVSNISLGGGPEGIYVSGHYAYVTNFNSNSLQVVDVSNPANPVLVGTLAAGFEPWSLYVQGRYAYVNDYGSGNLQVIDVSNPSSPIIVGTVISGEAVGGVFVSGRYAYVTNYYSASMQIIDVSNPSSPVVVGTVTTGTDPTGVYVSGHYAYVTNNSSSSMQIIDISNPADPVHVGTTTTTADPNSVYVQGNYAYVASYGGGPGVIQIFNLGGAYTQSLQAGSTETTSLQVDGTANIGGSESISGGLIVGQSEAVSGSLSLNGNIEDGNALDSFDLPTPNTPNVTFIGTPASTTYSYQVAAVASNLTTSTASAIGTVIGSATLTAANYTDISISPVQGAAGYYLYRTAGGTSQGIIAIIANTSLTPVTPTGFSGTTSLQLTINSQTFAVGQQVVLSGFVPTLYNVTAFITATATNSITVAIPGGAGAITTEGTVTGQLNIADTALIANTSYTPPTVDSSGVISIAGQATIKTNTNTTTAFNVENAAGFNVLDVDTSTSGGQIVIGTSSHVNAQIVLNNSTNTNTITLLSGATSSSYSLTLPTTGPSSGQCLTASSTTQLAFNACSAIVSGGTIIHDHESDTDGSPISTFPWTASHTGDVIVMEVTVFSSSITLTSITSGTGCVTTWHEVTASYDAPLQWANSLWEGTTTSSGTCTAIAFNFSSSIGTTYMDVNGDEYNAQLGSSTVWSVVDYGTLINPSTTTDTFPSLEATSNNEMYWGYAVPHGSGPNDTNGTPAGFNYITTADSNGIGYDTSLIGGNSYAATMTESSAETSDTLDMILSATLPSNFILDGTTTQSANLNVQAASSGTVAGVFEANGSGTADILDLQNSSGIDVASVGGSAAATLLNVNTTLSTVSTNQLAAPGTITPTLAPTAPTITNGGTAGAVTYTYEVTATDANGATTVNSLTANTTTGNANLSASNYNKVAWSAPTSTPTSYNIYRTAVGAAGYPNSTGLIGTVATSTTSGVTPSAFTMSGTVATITFTTPPNYTVGQYVLLAGFTPSGINNSGTPVAITAISGATIKVIIPGGPYTETGMGTVTGQLALADIGNTASGSVPTTSGTLTNATQYYFKVTAIDSTGGQTTPSSELTGTTGSTNTVATTGTNRAITLSWAPVTGARGYDVYYSTSTNTETLIATTYTNSYTLSALGSPSGSPPTTNTAYNNTLTSSGNSQITLGNIAGSASTAQLDVAGNLTPNFIGSTSNGIGNPESVAVQGNYAYVANVSNGMVVYDVSNPANPVEVSSTTIGAGSGSPFYITISGKYAYMITFGSALVIVDISNPTNPVEVGYTTTSLNTPSALTVSGHYAYVTSQFGTGGLVIFDVSNPASPVKVGSTLTGIANPEALTVVGRYAYVLNSGGTLIILDISNPADPVEVGSTVNGELTAGSGIDTYITVSGKYAYVTNRNANTLIILNISNPTNPFLVGFTTSGLSNPYSVVIYGHYAYVASYGNESLVVFDISNPADPIEIGTTTTVSTTFYSVAIQGNYAYLVGTGTSALVIFSLGGAYTQSLQAGSTETSSLQVDGTANIGGSESISGGLIVGQSEAISGSLSLNGNISDGSALATTDLPTPAAPTLTQVYASGTGGTTYTYSIAAVASNGTTSAASLATTVTNGYSTLSATNYNDLSLSPVQGASSYNVYRTAGGAAQGLIGNVTNTSLGSFTPTGFSGTTSLQLTINSQTFAIGQQVVLSGFVPTLYNVTAFITATATNSITVAIPGGAGAITTEGTVTGQLNIADTALIANATYSAPTVDSSGILNVTGYSVFQSNTNSTTAFQYENAAGTSILSVDTQNSTVNIGSGGPLNLPYVGQLGTDLSGPESVAISGNYAYVVSFSNSTLVSYNISTGTPVLQGDIVGGDLSGPEGIAISGNYAFVTSFTNSELVGFNISTGTPTLIGDLGTDLSGPEGIAISGTNAFVASFTNSELVGFNISSGTPVLNGQLGTDLSGPEGVAIYGNYAFVTSFTNSELVGFTITTGTPVLNGELGTDLSGPEGIAISGTNAFVASFTNSQLVSFAISTGTPVLNGQLGTNLSGPDDVTTYGNYAYVASKTGGALVAFNVSASNGIPTYATKATTSITTPEGMATNNNYIFVTSYGGSVLDSFSLPYQLSVSGGTQLNGNTIIGAGITGDTTGYLAELDNKTTSGDPTEVNGGMYYNSNTGNFRCGVSGSWENCIGGLLGSSSPGSPVASCTAACGAIATGTSLFPANYCVAGRVIHIVANGVYSDTLTPTLALSLYLGTNAAKASDTLLGGAAGAGTAATAGSTVTSLGWSLDAYIYCVSSTSVWVQGGTIILTSSSTGTGVRSQISATSATTITNTTQNLYIFPAWSANSASNTIISHEFIVQGM